MEPTRFPKTEPVHASNDVLTAIIRKGAQDLLAAALHAEVNDYVQRFTDEVGEDGRRLVTHHGFCKSREVQTGIGPVPVTQPRVNDRRRDCDGNRVKFTSSILPPYLRRTKSIEDMLPWLYLKGVSTGGFQEALGGLLGADAPGLSAATIVRLKKVWEVECEEWGRRDLSGKQYVYIWVDGIHFNIRLEEDRQCILVVMGATADGKKELIAVHDGHRESEQSWYEVLLDLKNRGLTIDPKVAVGDGALGFWKALPKVWPSTKVQRCWVHKTANILNKLPKKLQPTAKDALHQIWMADTRKAANDAFDQFITTYEAKYPKATACLSKDREELTSFFDYPAEHWMHLRTTNPIESTFATVRLRTKRTKGSGSRKACLAMVFRLAQAAERKWRRLNGHKHLADIVVGVQFKDGTKVIAA